MKMVRPSEIDDTAFISSNVTDSIETIWDDVTTFTVGSIVYVAATHHEYEAITENIDIYPPDDIDSSEPKWLDLGATNRWRMFDGIVGSHTLNTGSISIVITLPAAGRFFAIRIAE